MPKTKKNKTIILQPVKRKLETNKHLSNKITRNIKSKTKFFAISTDNNKKNNFLFEEEVAKFIHRHGIGQYSCEYRQLLNQAEANTGVESEEIETTYSEREETSIPFSHDDWLDKICRKAKNVEKEGWEAFYN